MIIHEFPCKEINLKMCSAKYWPNSFGVNVLSVIGCTCFMNNASLPICCRGCWLRGYCWFGYLPVANGLNWIMMTSLNGNIFRVTGPLCGEFIGHRWIPTQRPMTRNFDVFFDLRLNKRLSKQSWDWWFETPSGSLWRHWNDVVYQRKAFQPVVC